MGKFFPKIKVIHPRRARLRLLAFFQDASFIAKVASFQSKIVTFIILIINELKVFCS